MLASVLKLTTSFTASERRTQLHSCHSGHAQNIKWFFATSWIGFQQLSREENIGWTHFKCQGNKVMISELISDMQSMQGFLNHASIRKNTYNNTGTTDPETSLISPMTWSASYLVWASFENPHCSPTACCNLCRAESQLNCKNSQWPRATPVPKALFQDISCYFFL